MNIQNSNLTDSNLEQYFSSLSMYVKESILQSGVEFQSEEELRSFVENLNIQS